MSERVYNVLFLCTANSARSIIAEALLNAMGNGRFRGYSAGSYPSGRINPYVAEYLESVGLSTSGARSKSWDEFARPGAPKMDFVFTVCDNAAGEACPIWPGQPVTAHWGIPDPAAVEGDDETRRRAISNACHLLTNRIGLFASLPLERLDSLAIKAELDRIGRAAS